MANIDYTTSGIVTKPVVLTAVARLLGASSIKDVGTLCTSDKINIWAKYKPVKYNTLRATGKSSSLEYWRANDGGCGINMGDYVYTSAKTFFEKIFLDGVEIKWTHVAPTGGQLYPFRLTDFEGYYKDAIQPFGDITDGEVVYITQDGNDYVAQLDLDLGVSNDDDYNLTPSDFKMNGISFSDFYPAIAIKINAKSWIMATSTQKLSDGSLSVRFKDVFSLGDSKGKTYDCIVCIATEQYNSNTGQEPGNIKYIGIPVSKKKIKFINNNNTVTPSGQQTGGGGGTNAQVYICVYGEFTNSAKTEMQWWYECYNNSKSNIVLKFNAMLGKNGVDNASALSNSSYEISLNAGKSYISSVFTKTGLEANYNYWTWAAPVTGSATFGWEASPVEEGVASEG